MKSWRQPTFKTEILLMFIRYHQCLSTNKTMFHACLLFYPQKYFYITYNALSLTILSTFQDLNIPIPPPAGLVTEPNAKRPRIDSSEVSSNSTVDGTKVYILPNGSVPCNKPLSDLIHIVKPHIRELVEDSNLVSILLKCSDFIYHIFGYNNFPIICRVYIQP